MADAATQPAWEAVIGLETHVQLGTDSKIFTAASTTFGDDPNTHIDPVVCGLPGTLPVLNQKVLEYAVKAAMALNLNIAEHSKFDRKQYFYPDLPKNYQISQYDEPIAEDGWIEVEVAEKGKETYLKTIGIERLHMEEDAGKLVHAGSDRLAGSTHSLVDYNRAGVALAEIVSKPDLRTGREAAEYASEIRRIMRYLGVSDGNMQEGSLRCDVNISVRRGPDAPFGTKVEIKNMNSFSAIQKACDYEIQRQMCIRDRCGLPGTLPVLNQKVLEYAVKAAMALNLNIAEHSKFDRKQYFYPDLPKNYQISQYDQPIAEEGWIEVEVAEKGKDTYLKKIGIERLHMEEDAGKLVHAGSDRLAGSTHSLVDYNRAGVALAEIVSKPDLRTGREAAEYASEIRRIMRYLGVSDGNMQEGSLRCDVNISVRRGPDAPFGTKVEIKNMNSFSAIQKACEYEIKRQIKAYETGEPIVQETRLWDEGKQLTKSMRSKEGASDYRYFPDPDLGPIEVSADQRESWRAELPELPSAKRHRYADELGLSQYDARVLTDEPVSYTHLRAHET